ncbi:hypothetical protein PO002_31560 [Cupriavidus necator]|uniref:hypothetical protein n=1 Tax=Cupriavidus necator TaxID=106590 RepID=UPI0039C22FA3
MQLNNIRLPFDVDVHCRSGGCWLRGAMRSVALKAGESARVSAYRRFDLYTMSHSLIAASDVIHFDVMASRRPIRDESGDHSRRNWTHDPAKPLTLKLARTVFGEPNAPWSRAHAARMLDLSLRDLSAWMLREGAALTNLVCEQRLMRALIEVSQGRGQHGRYGFVSRERRDTAFFERFGVCVEQVAVIGRVGTLSWSGNPVDPGWWQG